MHPAITCVIALAVLAGCLAATPAPQTPGASSGGWSLDCTLGAHESAPWAQRCEARASHTPATKAETWLAIDPKDPNNVVIGAKDMDPDSSDKCVWNGIAVTHDGGKSWKDVTIGGKFKDRAPGSPFYGYACNTDAMFAFTKDGALHFGVEMYQLGPRQVPDPTGGVGPAGWHILLATSHDGGDTWPDVIDFQLESGSTTDYSRMTVSPKTQTILEAINNIGAPGVTCHVLSSRDGGKSAAPPVKVTPKELPADSVCRGIAAAPDGTLVIAFKEGLLTGDRGVTAFAHSTDDGLTWLDSNEGFSFKPIPDPFEGQQASSRAGQQIEIKYAPDGTLWCVTSEAPQGNADVFVRSSKDHGKTWSQPVRVNDDNGTTHQWMPQIAFGGDGSLHVFFFDKRYDPQGRLVDVTHALSLDGGKSWTNERVTSKGWDPDLGRHQDGYPWIGDYIGADGIGEHVWVGVPDTSLGDAPVIAAAHVRKT